MPTQAKKFSDITKQQRRSLLRRFPRLLSDVADKRGISRVTVRAVFWGLGQGAETERALLREIRRRQRLAGRPHGPRPATSILEE